MGSVGEDAVIAHEILVRGRHERGEASQEGHGLEGEVGPRGVRFWPGPVQLIEDVSVGGDGDSVQGKGGAKAVAAELLESGAILGHHGAEGVQGEAIDLCAERFWRVTAVVGSGGVGLTGGSAAG